MERLQVFLSISVNRSSCRLVSFRVPPLIRSCVSSQRTQNARTHSSLPVVDRTSKIHSSDAILLHDITIEATSIVTLGAL